MILKTNCSNILSTSSVKLTLLCMLLAPVSLLAFFSENILPKFLQQYLLEFSYFSPFLMKTLCFQWEEALTKLPEFPGSCNYGPGVFNEMIVPSGPTYLWDALSELVSRSNSSPYPSPELTPVSYHLIIPIPVSAPLGQAPEEWLCKRHSPRDTAAENVCLYILCYTVGCWK